MEANEKYLTNQFMYELYNEIQPRNDLLTCTEEEIDSVRKERISKLEEVLKLKEIKQMFETDLSYKEDGTMQSMGMHIQKYEVHTVRNLPFPIYHIKPDKSKGKTILYLHGHDDLGIMGALLERTDKVRYHKLMPVKLAKQGYDVIAPELIGFGESGFYGFPQGEDRICGCLINERYLRLAGFSIGGFRVYQAVRTLDFIEKLGLCDNITALGISGGGMTCQHLAVIEQRVKNVVIACYANTYKNSVLAKEHCEENYIPGLLRVGDSFQLLSMAAPKPLLTVNGLGDRGFPEEGSRKAIAYLKKVYERLGAGDRYEGRLFQGRHEINEEIVMEWLARNA